jgi:hypothetical protein
MKGSKTVVLYMLTQLVDGFGSIPDVDLPSAIFRYAGKHAAVGDFRHFSFDGFVSSLV